MFNNCVSIRPEHKFIIRAVILRPDQVSGIVDVFDLRVSYVFGAHQVILIIVIALISYRSPQGILQGCPAVSVCAVPSYSFINIIAFIHYLFVFIQLLNTAVSFISEEQTAVSIVIHCQDFIPAFGITVCCPGKSFGSGDQLSLFTVVMKLFHHTFFVYFFHFGIAVFCVEKQAAVCFIICHMAFLSFIIFIDNPGISFRACCQFILLIIPSLAFDQIGSLFIYIFCSAASLQLSLRVVFKCLFGNAPGSAFDLLYCIPLRTSHSST